MYRTKEDKQKYIDKIFSDKALFEWEVLHVSSHYDRLEIMQILAQTLVRDRLKYEINFLHMKSYSDFHFTPIINILFHEIANEWLSFVTDVLYYPKEDAIEELQNKGRIQFIHSLVRNYYNRYKRVIFEEIADTFIELVGEVKNAKDRNPIIEEVLQSDLIKNKQILAMNDFSQLWARVKVAKHSRKTKIVAKRTKISEIKAKYDNRELNRDEKQQLFVLLNKNKKELKQLINQKIDSFDAGIKRLKDTMVQSMIGMSHLS